MADTDHPERLVTQTKFPPSGHFQHGRHHVFRHGIGVTALGAGKTDALGGQVGFRSIWSVPIVAVATNFTGAAVQQRGVHGGNRPHEQRVGIAHRTGGNFTPGHQPHLAQRAKCLLDEGDIWIGNDSHIMIHSV